MVAKKKATKAEAKKKLGRPNSFTIEIGERIIEGILSEKSIREIMKPDDMPSFPSFFRWLIIAEREDAPENLVIFRNQYARAKEMQAEIMEESMLEIVDDGRNDWMEKNGGAVPDKEAVQRSKLRFEARKWLMIKLRPKKYGEKLELEHSGSIEQMSDEAVESKLAQLVAKTGNAGSTD